MMPATEWLGGGEMMNTIATGRRNTIYHNNGCRPGGVGFKQQQQEQDWRCVDAVARSSNGRGGMPPYAVLPRATHVDRRRRVSGAALVEAGYLEATWRLLGRLLGKTTWTGAVECGPAALVRIRHSDTKRQHAGTETQARRLMLRDSAMGGGRDWTGTRPSCNLRADRRCLRAAWEGAFAAAVLGSVAAKPKRKGPGIREAERAR